MEERRPTYDLDAIKATFDAPERLAITISAFKDAIGLGFDRAAIVDVIQGLRRQMFVKSMTTHADHRAWQDVCHAPADSIVIYVKFQADVVTEFRVMAFKEK